MRRIVILLGIIFIPLTFIAAANPESAAQPEAYVLIEASTGIVLEELNGDKQLNAGQLGKLMSLLLIAEDIDSGRFSLDTLLTASQSVTGTKGAVVWLRAGDTMSVEDLLKSVIIGNANDAMTVLAEASEGSIDAFTKRMNASAFDLGLRDTAFYSPYGYYDERELTTAHDMAVICARLSEYDLLVPYFSTWRDFVKEGTVELVNENTLSRTYSRHIGFKASHSEQSGYCAAEGARSESGTTYISVVIGAKDEDTSLGTAKKLCNKGFSDYHVTLTMFPDEMLLPIKVKNGRDMAVSVGIKEQSTLVLPNGSGELRTVTVLPDFLTAPVREGQKIGTAAFYNGKTLIFEEDIVTSEAVERLTFGYVVLNNLSKLTE